MFPSGLENRAEHRSKATGWCFVTKKVGGIFEGGRLMKSTIQYVFYWHNDDSCGPTHNCIEIKSFPPKTKMQSYASLVPFLYREYNNLCSTCLILYNNHKISLISHQKSDRNAFLKTVVGGLHYTFSLMPQPCTLTKIWILPLKWKLFQCSWLRRPAAKRWRVQIFFDAT